jgi:hypothetical protein
LKSGELEGVARASIMKGLGKSPPELLYRAAIVITSATGLARF